MIVRTLSWAGIEARSGECRVLVDPLEDAAPLRNFLGVPRAPLVPVTIDEQTWALVTHLHADHCDRQLLARVPPRQTLCHRPIESPLAERGVMATATELWETTSVGPFRVTAVPAHDWRGDDQVAWIIECEGRRIVHCGDTIWQGAWYEIARRCGPFDVAFLPINGAIVRLEGFTPTDVPATLTPEQAIEAALILRARSACAIHHTVFHNPPRYMQQAAAIDRFFSAARKRGIDPTVLPAGSRLPRSSP